MSSAQKGRRTGLTLVGAAVLAMTPWSVVTERASGIEGQALDRYVVVLRSDVGAAARAATMTTATDLVTATGGRVTDRYAAALPGFAALLTETGARQLQGNPAVELVERDLLIETDGEQRPAPHHLDRIDERTSPTDGRYRWTRTGRGVTAYVVDTGLRSTHRQLRGRVRTGFTAVRDGRGTGDCNGHGTHVAGVLGGTRYGVAKRVRIRPVRVLRCDGTGRTSAVVAGLDWIIRHHRGSEPAVANLSLSGKPSRVLDQAVQRTIEDGVTVVVAAGNQDRSACYRSPARLPAALTIGSTMRRDEYRYPSSNYGPCVDLWAPGEGIVSAWNTGDRDTMMLSGTSTAAPQAAGVAAMYLQGHPKASPRKVRTKMLRHATQNIVGDAGGRGRLLYTLHRAGIPPRKPPSGNLLTNGNFEEGATGWHAAEGVITDDPTVLSRDGEWKARLGAEPDAYFVEQTLRIPFEAGAKLSFHLHISTLEPPGNGDWDQLFVLIRKEDGGSTELAAYGNQNSNDSYEEQRFDVSAYAGETVTLRFWSSDDGDEHREPTHFHIDGVRLTTG